MNKMLRGEVPSDEEDDFDDADGGGDGGIDLFAPVDGIGGGDSDGDDDEEEEEGDLDAAGVHYSDFFDPPSSRGGDAKDKGKRKGKGKGKDQPKADKKPAPKPTEEPAADDSANADQPPAPKKARRGVRFSDAVKVKEIPHRLAEKKRLLQLAADNEIDQGTLEERLEELVAGSDEEEGDSEEEEEDEEMDEGEEEDDAAALDLDGFGDEEMDQPGSDEGSDAEDDAASGGFDQDGDEGEIAEGAETIDRFKSELFADEPEEDDKSEFWFALPALSTDD